MPAYAKFKAKLQLAKKEKVKPPVKKKRAKKKVHTVADGAWVRGDSTDGSSSASPDKSGNSIDAVPVKEGSLKAKLEWLKAMESETKKIKSSAMFGEGSKTFK